MGQHLVKQNITTRTNESGYESKITIYAAKNCERCPLKGLCTKSKGDRTIEINQRLRHFKNQARELLHSEEGIEHRKRRSVEPEPVFSHIRYNGQYLRFRHFGIEKIEMDFGIFAIALNINKLYKYLQKKTKLLQNNHILSLQSQFLLIITFFLSKNQAVEKFSLKLAA
ncbi:MAG: transposase [Culturomica sp.]|nr:transposase [Culturomica sp.]